MTTDHACTPAGADAVPGELAGVLTSDPREASGRVTTILRNVVVDCHDPVSLAGFWAAALGWAIEPIDDATRARLEIERGVDALHERITLIGPASSPRLYFQRVDDPTPGKNRLHLDLEVDDADEEAKRLQALGAHDVTRIVETLGGAEERWIVLRDPEGNVFCIQTAGSPQFP